MDKLLRLYWQLKTLRSQDPTCLDFLSPEELAQLEKMLGSVQKVADSPSGSKIIQALNMPDKAGIGNKGMRKDIDPVFEIVREAFVTQKTAVECREYMEMSVGEEAYLELKVSQKTLGEGTKVYLLKDVGEQWFACLDLFDKGKEPLIRFNIGKMYISPKNSAELAKMQYAENIQILRDVRPEIFLSKNTIPIQTIRKNTIIEFANTNTLLIPELEVFIGKIWAGLQTNAQNLNVTITCIVTFSANTLQQLNKIPKYSQPVGFSFTRVQLGTTPNQILLVEELDAVTLEDTSTTAAEAAKAEDIRKNYNIKFSGAPMDKKEELAILEALNLLPPKLLQTVQGLTFEKYSKEQMDNRTKKGENKNEHTGGFYDASINKIVLSHSSFRNELSLGSNQPYKILADGTPQKDAYNSYLQYVVLHETGHAVDIGAYIADRQNYSTNIWGGISTKYKEKAKKLNPTELEKWQKEAYEGLIKTHGKQKIFASKYSGLQTICNNVAFTKGATKTIETVITSDFMKAVNADGKTPTDYASTNSKEAFAECFALYFAFPSKLKDISPNVFNWFENENF